VHQSNSLTSQEAVYAHTIAVYGDLYFKSTNDVMRLTGSTLEDYWREASKDFESQGKEELGNIRNPYELCFHNMVSKVYGASYGVENFTVEMGLDGGESNLQEVQLGVNETGLLVFDVDSGGETEERSDELEMGGGGAGTGLVVPLSSRLELLAH
jgi:hypothetical protein